MLRQSRISLPKYYKYYHETEGGKKTSMHWGTECKYNYFPLTDLLEGTHS